MVAFSLLPLLLATAALAAPSRRDGFRGDCNVPPSAVTLPASFDPLPTFPNFFLLGVGVQNYTCNSGGKYDSVGATAQLFEISCLSQLSGTEFSTIRKRAFSDWNAFPSTNPLEPGLVQLMKDHFNLNVQGQHYFVQQGSKLVPVWDLSSSGENRPNPNAIVFAEKVASAPSPDGSNNVDWAEFKKSSGKLANIVYQVDTVEGQPPSTCTPGSHKSVKYTSHYLFI